MSTSKLLFLTQFEPSRWLHLDRFAPYEILLTLILSFAFFALKGILSKTRRGWIAHLKDRERNISDTGTMKKHSKARIATRYYCYYDELPSSPAKTLFLTPSSPFT
jgi:hypothetical protein